MARLDVNRTRQSALLAATLCLLGVRSSVVIAASPNSSAGSAAAEAAALSAATGYQPRDLGPPIKISDADRKGHDLMLRVLNATRERESQFNEFYGSANVVDARQQYAAAVNDEQRLQRG